MTLIEILIVLAIGALMVGMVVVGFSTSRSAELVRTVNQVSNVIRYGYDKARVDGKYYRLLINFDERSFTLQQGDGKMYLPATDRDGEIIEFDEGKAQDQADRDARAEQSYNQSLQSQVYDEAGDTDGGGSVDPLDAYKPAPRQVPRRKPPLFEGFEEENALTGVIDPFKLPEGVKIVSVRTADDLEPITEGEASIYFFPRGRTQQAHILIEDEEGDAKWTIKIAPLTGRVTLDEGHEELELPGDPTDKEDDLGNRRQRRTF